MTRTARLKISAALAAFAALAPAAAGAAVAGGNLGPVGQLPAGWSHAQINVVIKRQPHTLTYDRGRVQSVGPSSLTLRERDGSVVTIAVAATTRITIAGRPAALAQIRRLEQATTVALDGGPATAVKVTIPPGVGAAIRRAGAGAGG